MSDVFRFGLIGMCSGALYVLAALGIVIVYRGSGVVNFAHGAIGMVGTYAYYEMRDQHHLPFVLALLGGMFLSALLGAATHFGVMRHLRAASNLARVIATLGVLAILQAAAALRYPQELIFVRPFLPHAPVRILGAYVGEDRLIILVLGVTLAGGLWCFYRSTDFGRATAASAENPRGAAALGLSPDRIAGINWALGSALAALAGICLVPISGLQVSQLTLLVIPSLAAAVVGNFSSFPLTVIAGLMIGVSESEVTRYVKATGWAEAVPFILMAIVLLLRGRSFASKGEQALRLPSIGSGRVRPLSLIGIVAATLAALYLWLSPNWIDVVNTQLVIAVILLSLLVVLGFAGQLSLAQFAFAGLGALVAGRVVADFGVPFELAILIGGLVTVPVGIVVGLAGVRTRGVNLAIITLGLAVSMEDVFFTSPSYTGGPSGTTIGDQHFLGIDMNTVLHPQRYGTVVLGFLVLFGLGLANLRRGRVGRRLIAVRSNERAAASLGISVLGAKLYAFSLGGFIAGVGGVLLAFRNTSISFDQFDVFRSINLVQDSVIGGVGWVAGAPVGASVEQGAIPSQLLNFLGSNVTNYLFLIGGVLLVLTVIRAPNGLVPLMRSALSRRRVAKGRGTRPAYPVDRPIAPPRVTPKSLTVEHLTVRFGGATALSDVSLRVEPGTIVGLIGPNGAGKTTTVEAVTGFVKPTSGSISLGDYAIVAWGRERRARAGLGRSFQSLELFDDMTVLENIQAGSEPRDSLAYITDLISPRPQALTLAARAAIWDFGLVDCLDKLPEELSFGLRRLVGLARTVAGAPSVILLDEPAAGLDECETAELGDLIAQLASRWGMAVLLIEHDVDLVMRICHRIYALDFGQNIASGRPEEVRNNSKVIAAYLGAETAASAQLPGRITE